MTNEIMNEVAEQVQDAVAEAAVNENNTLGKLLLFGAGFVAGVGAAVSGYFVRKAAKKRKVLKQCEDEIDVVDEADEDEAASEKIEE